ncbi:hypothetical protein LBMAG38_25910 [Chloroflexota bacterium]|nr:hypothetical protein LBMAG38_25910 [Chloroflexota bacterium]
MILGVQISVSNLVGCSTPSTTVSNALCRIAHGRGVAVGVDVAVEVDVGVFEEVADAVAVT